VRESRKAPLGKGRGRTSLRGRGGEPTKGKRDYVKKKPKRKEK